MSLSTGRRFTATGRMAWIPITGPQITGRVTDRVKQTSQGPYSRAFCIPNVKLGTLAESLTTLENCCGCSFIHIEEIDGKWSSDIMTLVRVALESGPDES